MPDTTNKPEALDLVIEGDVLILDNGSNRSAVIANKRTLKRIYINSGAYDLSGKSVRAPIGFGTSATLRLPRKGEVEGLKLKTFERDLASRKKVYDREVAYDDFIDLMMRTTDRDEFLHLASKLQAGNWDT